MIGASVSAVSRAAIGLSLVVSLAGCNREPLDVAPDVDLDRFQGRWHEIAHFARATQADCTGTTATYTRRPDGNIAVAHECTLKGGAYHGATAIAHVPDARTPGKMEIEFSGHLGDYWIIDVAPDYRYAVIGHPSRDYLWILSRTPSMETTDLDLALTHAREKSFDTNRLEYTPKGPEPSGTPAPPVAYGCTFAPAGGPMGTSETALLLVGLAFTVHRRRRVSGEEGRHVA